MNKSEIDPEVATELKPLISELDILGFKLISTQYGGMSYVADFKSDKKSLRIVKDRGQWFLEGERKDLEANHLFRVYNSLGRFTKTIVEWIKKQNT